MIVIYFKHKTAYKLRISIWSSDVFSSELLRHSDEIAAEPTTWMLPVKRLSWPQDKLQATSQHNPPWDRWASVEDARGWMLDSYTAMRKRLASSEKRRVGKECVSTHRTRWTKIIKNTQ